MPRPMKRRCIESEPAVDYFKPRGVPMMDLLEVYLTVDGLEAIRLVDREGLSLQDAAERMNVSRHTLGRLLADARRRVAEALVQGRALRIEGGHWELVNTEDQAPTERIEETEMTKIAVTSEGPTLDDRVDPRFGRAGGFVVVDPETMEAQYVDNGQSQAMAQGAGIQAAERIVNAGAGIVLTGFVGPKAFSALRAAGVEVGQNLDGITVREAVERFKTGSVEFAASPNR